MVYYNPDITGLTNQGPFFSLLKWDCWYRISNLKTPPRNQPTVCPPNGQMSTKGIFQRSTQHLNWSCKNVLFLLNIGMFHCHKMMFSVSLGILAHLLRMAMEPKYLPFRRWLDTLIIVWKYDWIPRAYNTIPFGVTSLWFNTHGIKKGGQRFRLPIRWLIHHSYVSNEQELVVKSYGKCKWW